MAATTDAKVRAEESQAEAEVVENPANLAVAVVVPAVTVVVLAVAVLVVAVVCSSINSFLHVFHTPYNMRQQNQCVNNSHSSRSP